MSRNARGPQPAVEPGPCKLTSYQQRLPRPDFSQGNTYLRVPSTSHRIFIDLSSVVGSNDLRKGRMLEHVVLDGI